MQVLVVPVNLEAIVSQYGYWAVFFGAIVGGETIVLIGGLAAHRGYFELGRVIVVAFAGTLVGDQLYFLLGRCCGRAILDRRPDWRVKADRVSSLIDQYCNLIILGSRLIYGIRTVTPFAIGMSDVGALRFLILNALAAGLWAAAVSLGGYAFVAVLEEILHDIDRYESHVFWAVAIVGACCWIAILIKRRFER